MTMQEKCPLHTFEVQIRSSYLREIKTHYSKPFLKADIFQLYYEDSYGFIT